MPPTHHPPAPGNPPPELPASEHPSPGWVAPVKSGLAIASLVLSILWLGGVGSILAVIFGIIALSQIRSSQGRKTGSGLAVAGLIIGGLGILGSVGFYVTVTAGTNIYSYRTLQLGQTGTYSTSQDDGVVAMTVDSVTFPFKPGIPSVHPITGDEFAVALVKECAGPDGAQATGREMPGFAWSLILGHGTSVNSYAAGSSVLPASVDAKSPGIDSFDTLAANQCVAGYITFEIANGSIPASIEYFGAIVHGYEWVLKS